MRVEALSDLDVICERDPVAVPGGRVESVCGPQNVDEVCEVVAWAARERAGLLVLGGCTRLGWANPAEPLALALSTRGLSGVDTFEPDEGVVHAAAGTPLAEVRQVVEGEGWELPLDSPGPNTTVGGTIASAVTGPRAQAFGAVKDALLGLEVVGGDGEPSKCGGRVVKNVTGYDMAKLYCGSFGSFAVVTGAWLRLRPLPACRETWRGELDAGADQFDVVRKLASRVSVRALVWIQHPGADGAEVIVEFGGSAEGVAEDRTRLAEKLLLEEAEPGTVDALRDARAVAQGPVRFRARVPGSRSEAMRSAAIEAGLEVSSDPGLGVVQAWGALSERSQLVALRTLAESEGGFLTVETMPEAWRGSVDAFGPLGGTASLVATLKERFDPAGILNPGRFVRTEIREEVRP